MLVLTSLAFPLLLSHCSTPFHGMKNNRANAEKMGGNRVYKYVCTHTHNLFHMEGKDFSETRKGGCVKKPSCKSDGITVSGQHIVADK